MSQEKPQLVPLQTAFDETISMGGIDQFKISLQLLQNVLPPSSTEVRCISGKQRVAILTILADSANYDISKLYISSTAVLDMATKMWGLAIKKCVACGTENCPFRENESSQ